MTPQPPPDEMKPPPDAPKCTCDKPSRSYGGTCGKCGKPIIESVKSSPAVPEIKCDLCGGSGEYMALVETATGSAFCPYLGGQCEACGGSGMKPAVPAQGGETPRTDIAAWTTGVSTEWRAVVDTDFARTLERELAEERRLKEWWIEDGKRMSLIVENANRTIDDLNAALTAAKQDSERLEWLLEKLAVNLPVQDSDVFRWLETREEIDAARREEA